MLNESEKNQDITSEAPMLLDSSHASVSALGAKKEPRQSEGIRIISTPEPQESAWYYFLLKNKELKQYNALLAPHFKTFIYTTSNHRKRVEDVPYTEAEYKHRLACATEASDSDSVIIGNGYLFVRAPIDALNEVLDQLTPHHNVMKDFATGQPAKIPDKQMKDFVMLYEAMPWNIHFMERPIADYARNRDRVRITGGSLRGAEGYIVRLHRDRNLVFSFGNMTLAVSDIHSYPFEIVK